MCCPSVKIIYRDIESRYQTEINIKYLCLQFLEGIKKIKLLSQRNQKRRAHPSILPETYSILPVDRRVEMYHELETYNTNKRKNPKSENVYIFNRSKKIVTNLYL